MKNQDTKDEVYSRNSNQEPSELSLTGGKAPIKDLVAQLPDQKPKQKPGLTLEEIRARCAPPQPQPTTAEQAAEKKGNLDGLIKSGSVFGPNGFDTTKFDGGRKLDFNAIDANLASDVEGRVREWYPGRKIEKAGEWLRIGKNGGLKVRATDGHWADHSEGASGPGLVSLYAWEFDFPKPEAARMLSNGRVDTTPRTRRATAQTATQEAPQAEYELALTEPGTPPTFDSRLGEPSRNFLYRTRTGEFAMVVARFDNDGGKDIRQLAWLKDKNGAESWQRPTLAAPAKNLLYRGEQLAQYPDKPVLIVEGEKCVEAIAADWTDWIILTWQGGTSTAAKADWSGLENRDVTIWPDNDEPGKKAAAAIAEQIPNAKIVDPLPDKPVGWDVADAVAEGHTAQDLQQDVIAKSALAQAPAESIWDKVPKTPIATPYIDLDEEPGVDDFKAFLKDVPLAEASDLVVISARLKSFKSSIVAAMACSLVAGDDVDCLGLKIRGEGVVLIFDTEQSTKEIQNQSKAMRRRLGVASTPERIKIVGLREYAPVDRMKIIKAAIEEQDDIAAVVVDGASDLCGNVNDPETSSTVVQFLMVAAVKANAPLFGVIHLNHSDREAMGGGRGHLGKEMERKAKAVVCVEKDADGVGTIYAATTRRQPVSKDNGQRVQFCSDRNMVVSIEGTKAEAKQSQEAEEMMHLIDELKDVTGTHVWKYSQLWKAIGDVEGLKERAAKKRIEKMLNAEVLQKSSSGNYVARTGNGILSCDPTQP